MSGHSKWSQIKRQKGVADVKRSTIFTKLGMKITLAAKEMGGDPEMNFKLRLAIEKAKEANMPKDNIDRAIKKGTGELTGGIIEEVIYEGFGPGGAVFLVETVTDNKNRTASELRNIFSKHNGNLGAANSVQWMFERKGVIQIEKNKISDPESVELVCIETGAEDIKNEENMLVVYVDASRLHQAKEQIQKNNIHVSSAEIEFIPKESLNISSDEILAKLHSLAGAIEDFEDVVGCYTNF